MRHTHIYALTDYDGSVRYIGKTGSKLPRRLSCHISEARCGKRNHRCNWIRACLAAGYKPGIKLLTTVSDSGSKAEIATIAQFRKSGAKLTNATDGGEGSTGYNPPEEVRRKIAAAHTGKKYTLERRQAISRALRGKKHTPEHIRNVVAANAGKRKMSPETKAKLVALNTGSHRSEATKAKMREAWVRRKLAGRGRVSAETRAKLSAAAKARPPVTAETRAKISAAGMGRRPSEETRAKLSAAQRRRPPMSAETKAKISATKKRKYREKLQRTEEDKAA